MHPCFVWSLLCFPELLLFLRFPSCLSATCNTILLLAIFTSSFYLSFLVLYSPAYLVILSLMPLLPNAICLCHLKILHRIEILFCRITYLPIALTTSAQFYSFPVTCHIFLPDLIIQWCHIYFTYLISMFRLNITLFPYHFQYFADAFTFPAISLLSFCH